MTEFLNYFLSLFDLNIILKTIEIIPTFINSLSGYFWFIIALPFLRFQLSDLIIWIIYLVRPQLLISPIKIGTTAALPLVSVVIAGRNVGDNIVATITSVFNCGYPHIEVLYIDDCSSDNSVAQARSLEATGRVRVFGSADHNGKPTSLNIGIAMARGEFVFILDSDCEVQYGLFSHLLAPFSDPAVGGVAANLRVRNARENLVTRFQECEYALNVTFSRLARSPVQLLSILPGAASLFRTTALRQMGGYDPGLGDDTDMTIRLRKQRWKLGFALYANVWTDVPNTWRWLMRQRMRWSRNMVKVRLHKQFDLYKPGRYGLANTIVFLDLLIFRVLPAVVLIIALFRYASSPFSYAAIVTSLYWLVVFFVLISFLITNDIANTPSLRHFWLALFYPLYRLSLRIIDVIALVRENLRIGLGHSYVPQKIWKQIPHW